MRIRLCHSLHLHHSIGVSVLEPLFTLKVVIIVHGKYLDIAKSCAIFLDHHGQPCHGCVGHPDLHPELPVMSLWALKTMLFIEPTNHLLNGTAVTGRGTIYQLCYAARFKLREQIKQTYLTTRYVGGDAPETDFCAAVTSARNF